MSGFRITDKTTIQQLDAFLQNAGPGTLRGKQKGKDVYKIYVNKNTFADKVTDWIDARKGKTAQRNADAHKAIRFVAKNFMDEHESIGFTPKAVKKLEPQITVKLGKNNGPLLKTNKAAEFTGKLIQTGQKIQFQPTPGKAPSPTSSENAQCARGPALKLNLTQVDGNVLSGLAMLAGTDKKTAVEGIAATIKERVGALSLPKEDLRALAMSSGDSVRSAVKEAMTSRCEELGVKVPADIDKLVNEAFSHFADETLGTKQVGAFQKVAITDGGGTHDHMLPVINVNGKDYQPTRQLGRGAFGRVYLYENPKDPNDKIAFKMFEEQKGDKAAESNGATIREVLVHERAMRGGNENIIRLEGPVRLSNGMIGVALEVAEHGTLNETATVLHYLVNDKSDAAVAPDKLSRAEAHLVGLTQLQGFINGLGGVKENDVFHRDSKSPNVILGKNGKPKIIDFGLAVHAKSVKFGEMPKVENPIYLSPEYHLEQQALKDKAAAYQKTKNNDLQDIAAYFMPGKKKDTPEQKKGLQEKRDDLLNALTGHAADDFAADAKANSPTRYDPAHDMWGATVAAIELFTGNDFLPELGGRMAAIENAIVAWARQPGAVVVAPPGTKPPLPANALMFSTGDKDIDDLINKMGSIDPKTRLTPEQALAHPAFAKKGVGDASVESFGTKLRAPGTLLNEIASAEKNVASARTRLEAALAYRFPAMIADEKAAAAIKQKFPNLTAADIVAGKLTDAQRDDLFALMPATLRSQIVNEKARLADYVGTLDKLKQQLPAATAKFEQDLKQFRESQKA